MASLAELMTGSALQSSQNAGQGFAEGLEQGAALALKKEQLTQKQAELDQKRNELLAAKFEKLGGFFESYAKMPEGGAKRAYGKHFIPKFVTANGLQDKIDPVVLEMLEKDSNLATALRSGVSAGEYDIGILLDPERIAREYPNLIQRYSAEEISQAIADRPEAFTTAASERQKNLAQQAGQQATGEQQFRTYAAQLNDDVAARFKPIKEVQRSLDVAQDAIAQLKAAQAAGKPLNPNLANAISRGIARAYNSGAMTDKDVADFQSRPGFAGFKEAALNKWITGNVDMRLINNLEDVLTASNKALSTQADRVAEGLQARLRAYPGREKELRAISGLDAYIKPQRSVNESPRKATTTAPVPTQTAPDVPDITGVPTLNRQIAKKGIDWLMQFKTDVESNPEIRDEVIRQLQRELGDKFDARNLQMMLNQIPDIVNDYKRNQGR